MGKGSAAMQSNPSLFQHPKWGSFKIVQSLNRLGQVNKQPVLERDTAQAASIPKVCMATGCNNVASKTCPLCKAQGRLFQVCSQSCLEAIWNVHKQEHLPGGARSNSSSHNNSPYNTVKPNHRYNVPNQARQQRFATMPRGDEVWVLQALSSSNPAISVDSKYVLKAGLNDVPDTLLAVLPQVTFVGAFKLQNSVGDQGELLSIFKLHLNGTSRWEMQYSLMLQQEKQREPPKQQQYDDDDAFEGGESCMVATSCVSGSKPRNAKEEKNNTPDTEDSASQRRCVATTNPFMAWWRSTGLAACTTNARRS
mmetsp:Transcript_26982/g.38291  ORF Transcript_26982/g.38291 Transcript_26982/m.38291 type:complete len:309 (+) Transcript_26982:260-1186(+)